MVGNEHISSKFDSELDEIRRAVLNMAELVEQQARGAIAALLTGDAHRLDVIVANDHQVNMMDMMIDEISVNVVARRQPTARDLRLLMAVGKTVTDLERIGDEAKEIARMGKLLHSELEIPRFHEISEAVESSMKILNKSMQAFANLDAELAAQVIRFDAHHDERFRVLLRHLVGCMMEDPRTISSSLSMLNIVKSVERMGAHALNVSEYVIYMVKGLDVRYMSREQIERDLT